MVQCGPEIVHNVAEDGAQFDWDVFLDANAVDILSALRISPSDEAVWLAVEERFNGRLEIQNVAFGPFNF